MTDEPKTKKKLVRVFWILLYNVGFLVGIFGGLEFGSSRLNQNAGEAPLPFLIDLDELRKAPLEVRQEGGTTKMSYLDPHLGYAHEHAIEHELSDAHAIPGFVVYGDAPPEDAFRIVTLGGSTTDALDPDNWPKQLQRLLAAEGLPVQVYNGGVSGYSTSQELLKLIRDVLPLEPDLLLSLSGVNDFAYLHSVPEHPMVHRYQERLLEAMADESPLVLLPNTRRAFQRWRTSNTPELERILGVNYGPAVVATPAELWTRNVQLMNAVSATSQLEFVGFLQPLLGLGAYNPTPSDKALIQDSVKMFGPHYLPLAEDFYAETKDASRTMPFVTDLTDAFQGKSGLYRDQRHPNAEGYGQLARAMRDELRARGLLPTGR